LILANQLEQLTELADRLLVEEQSLNPEQTGFEETAQSLPRAKAAQLRKS